MKKRLPIIGIVLVLLAGIGVLSYPLISSVINNFASRSQAEEYTKTVKLMPSEQSEKMIEEARRYNASLSNNLIITDPFDQEQYKKISGEYESVLNVDDSGLIGYIDIPCINVYLPIYHGTDEHILAKGAGHVQNTSLPVGGESTHSVISAHSAYPGETFFDYLTDMKEGNEFYVHILDRTLKYEVDQIKVILPEETDDLRIIEGGDYVTLLTCTPYSINTHRLLVRGERVEYDDSEYITTGASVISFQDYLYLLGYKIPYWAAGTFIGAVIVGIIVLIVVLRRKSKKKSSKNKHSAENSISDTIDENES